MGLEGALSARDDHLVGIVNGVDYDEWCPDRPSSPPYGPGDLSGKRVCRDRLLDELNLAPDPTGPVGIVSRMTGQRASISSRPPVFLQSEDVRLVVLGSGDAESERYFQWLRDSLPHKVGVYMDTERPRPPHRGGGGSSVPSRYEPCGLNQMYSLRYGTVPLVRATGGLADTVERWDRARGDGVLLLRVLIGRPPRHLRHPRRVERPRRVVDPAGQRMARDFSWGVQVQAYEDLYAAILAEHSADRGDPHARRLRRAVLPPQPARVRARPARCRRERDRDRQGPAHALDENSRADSTATSRSPRSPTVTHSSRRCATSSHVFGSIAWRQRSRRTSRPAPGSASSVDPGDEFAHGVAVPRQAGDEGRPARRRDRDGAVHRHRRRREGST